MIRESRIMDIDKIIEEVIGEIRGSGPRCPDGRLKSVCACEVPARLEHSLLNPDVSLAKIREECAQARRYCVAAVCVAPYYIAEAREILSGSGVKVGTAVGFPHGCMSTAAKLADVRDCVVSGAQEIDVAVNILAVKSGNFDDARREFEQVAQILQGKAVLKAVFEHSVYSDEEKIKVLQLAKECGAGYVKIQNVLSGKPADTAQIRQVRDILGRNIKIKIDGGVKTLDKALELIGAGADRIGLTATVAIAKEAEGRS